MKFSMMLAVLALGFVLAGCCGTQPSLFGAPEDCGKPVYRAPDCAGRVQEAPGAPEVQSAPFWEKIRWPWQCDESRRGQPVYKKPDCEAFNAKVGGFFKDLNNKVFDCEPTPMPTPAAAAEKPCE